MAGKPDPLPHAMPSSNAVPKKLNSTMVSHSSWQLLLVNQTFPLTTREHPKVQHAPHNS